MNINLLKIRFYTFSQPNIGWIWKEAAQRKSKLLLEKHYKEINKDKTWKIISNVPGWVVIKILASSAINKKQPFQQNRQACNILPNDNGASLGVTSLHIS